MGRVLLLLLLFTGQEPGADELIRQLGDSDPAVRDRAMDTLEGKGSEAIEGLKRAARHPDLEIRSRISEILSHLEPALLLDEMLKAERARRFSAPPMRYPSWANAAAIDGAWFSFGRKLWVSKGEVQGLVVTSQVGGLSNCEIQWNVVSVLAGCEVPVERCADHSPHLIFLPADCSDSVIVKIEGIRSWTCDVPVTIRAPRNGARRQIGPYAVTIDWPFIEVTTEKPVWADLFSATLIGTQITCRYKPGRQPPPAEASSTGPTDEPVIFFPEAVERGSAWCGCREQPRKPGPHNDPATMRRMRICVPQGTKGPIEDVVSISFPFHLPVEEPFEVTSPPLE
jgi:hypothetical protein